MNLGLGYCSSVHRSQGNEYKVIIIPMLMSQKKMLQRRLFYTAVTRGKEILILVGQAAAIKHAIRTKETEERRTLLAQRINEYINV